MGQDGQEEKEEEQEDGDEEDEEQEKEVCAPGFDAGADVSSRIVMNLLTEFPSAVFAFVCPVIPSASALASKGFSVRLSCALGQSAVWILTAAANPLVCSGSS